MNLFDALFPQPQWILTDYATQRLKEIGQYSSVKNTYDTAVKNTNDAYAAIIPNTISGVTGAITTPIIIIGIIAIAILILWKK